MYLQKSLSSSTFIDYQTLAESSRTNDFTYSLSILPYQERPHV